MILTRLLVSVFFLLYFSVTTHNHHDHLCKMITNNRLLLPPEEMGFREHIPVRRNAANPGFQGRTSSHKTASLFPEFWILSSWQYSVHISRKRSWVLNAALNIWQCPVFKKAISSIAVCYDSYLIPDYWSFMEQWTGSQKMSTKFEDTCRTCYPNWNLLLLTAWIPAEIIWKATFRSRHQGTMMSRPKLLLIIKSEPNQPSSTSNILPSEPRKPTFDLLKVSLSLGISSHFLASSSRSNQ